MEKMYDFHINVHRKKGLIDFHNFQQTNKIYHMLRPERGKKAKTKHSAVTIYQIYCSQSPLTGSILNLNNNHREKNCQPIRFINVLF